MALLPKQPAKIKQALPAKTKNTKTVNGAESQMDIAAATALSRDALARDRFIFLLRIIYGLIAALFISIIVNVYLGTRPVEFRYFATTPTGAIREIVALNRPVQSTNEVLSWTTQVITRAYSVSFANHEQQLADIRPNFTEPGWRGFEQALSRSGFIEKILSQQFVSSAVPQSAPVVVAEGLVDGAYAWRLTVPILVTYQSANARTSQTVNVQVTVVRRPETENPKGLGIAQIVAN